MTLKTMNEFDFRALRRVSIRASLLGGVAVLLAGCVTVQQENGIAILQASTSADLGKEVAKIGSEDDAATAKARVDAFLKRSLSADAAVQIALWNNRGLQAALNELGIADAQRMQASLPPNPRISVARTTMREENSSSVSPSFAKRQ